MIGRLLLALLGLLGIASGLMLMWEGTFGPVCLGAVNAAGGLLAILWAILEEGCCCERK